MKKYPALFVWAQRILIGSLALLPLFYIKSSLFPFTTPKSWLILTVGTIAIGLLTTLWVQDKTYRPKAVWFFGIYAVYLLWLSISSVFGESLAISLWGTFRSGNGIVAQLGILMYSFAFFWIAQKRDVVRLIAVALGLGGVGISLYVYAAKLFPSDAFLMSQWNGGTLGNSSVAGAYLIASLAAITLLIARTHKLQRLAWIMAGLCILLSPVYIHFSGSAPFVHLGEARAAALSILVGCVLGAIVWAAYSGKKIVRYGAYAVTVMMIIVGGIFAYLFFQSDSAINRSFSQAATESRFLYPKIAFQGMVERPITGWGWEHFPIVFQQHFDPINLTEGYAGETRVWEPHNMPLQVGVTAGIPGFVLYLVMIGSLFVVAVYSVRKNYFDRTTGAVFFGYFCAYTLQNLFFFDTPAPQAAFFVMAALVTSYAFHANEDVKKQNMKNRIPVIAHTPVRIGTMIMLWLVVGAVIWFTVFVPARESIMIRKLSMLSITDRAKSFEKVFNISFQGLAYDEGDLLYSYSDQYLRSKTAFSADEITAIDMELVTYQSFVDRQLESGLRYSRLYLAGYQSSLFLFMHSKGKDSTQVMNMQRYADELIVTSPHSPSGYTLKAQALVYQGDIEAALNYAEQAVQLEPRVLESQTTLLKIAQLLHNQERYNRYLQQARVYFPNETF